MKMRKSGKVFLWPLNFESSVSRKNGRKVSKSLSLNGVSVKEIMKAVEDLDLRFEVELAAARPSQHWSKSGLVLVEKSRSKCELLRLVAEKMHENRSLEGEKFEKVNK